MVAVALGLAGCGGSSKSTTGSTSTASSSTTTAATSTPASGTSGASASDKASGITVSVSGDKVTVRRSAASTAGTGGAAGQVACTTDYRKLATATAEPAPTLPWYAATLITWPAANAASTATLSHPLSRDPDLCIAESSASQTQVVLYFRPGVKTGIQKLQQASQATAALTAAAGIAVTAKTKGAFPAPVALLKAISAQGLYDKSAADISAVTEIGTVYLIVGETTTKQVVLAMKGGNGVIHTATQALTGKPKLGTAKG